MLGRVLNHALFGDGTQGRPRDGAAERIAAKGTAMFTGLQHPKVFNAGEHGGDRIKPAGKRLAEQGHIGFDAFVLLGQKLACAA